MSVLDVVHGRLLFNHRVGQLAAALAGAVPPGASVLDVGSGDGSIAAEVMERRPDVTITGVDVLVRPEVKIRVEPFDGVTLPFPDRCFDVVSFVDVLHHTDDPDVLLAEARRVTRRSVLVKDHVVDGLLARPTLRLMDWVGNARHGVRLPYNYLTQPEWDAAFARVGLEVASWDQRPALYGPPLSLVFGRRLHVLAELRPAPPRTS